MNKRVLIVDDNVNSATILSSVLTSRGHDTQTFYNGTSALDAVSRFAPDVAILDISLPDMNGYDLARELSSRVKCTLIAITGNGGKAAESSDAGFQHHMLKPVDLQALLQIIAQSE